MRRLSLEPFLGALVEPVTWGQEGRQTIQDGKDGEFHAELINACEKLSVRLKMITSLQPSFNRPIGPYC